MSQLRSWSFRFGAALCIAVASLLVMSVSLPAGVGHSGCSNPCRPFFACITAKKPSCVAPSTNKLCKCAPCIGIRWCVCIPRLPG